MRLPELTQEMGKAQREILAIRGMNWSDNVQDGDMRDSLNISARRFPYLSTRRAREKQKKKSGDDYTGGTALTSWGKLVAVEGTDLLYDGEVVGQVLAGEKQFAVLNTKMVIWPDKKYLDMQTKTILPLGAAYTGFASDVIFTESTLTVPEESYIDRAAAETAQLDLAAETAVQVYTGVSLDKKSGEMTLLGGTKKTASQLQTGDFIQQGCDSKTEYMLVQGNAAQDDGTYRIAYCLHQIALYQYPSFTDIFHEGDAVSISGCVSCEKNNGSHVIRGVAERTLTFTKDLFSQTGAEAGQVELERKIPDMDFICESENRLWGCSNETQSIYASSMGDPTNFYVYEGLSTDSYTLAVGSEGDFTGCCKLGSSVLFWKETKLHKMLGGYPAEYSLYSYDIEGLQAGCHKSLQVINEVLFYMGLHGVYAYSGGTPARISDSFGDRNFTHVVAGNDGDSYYFSATDGTEQVFLVYETQYGMWFREDDTAAVDFARIGKDLYFMDSAGCIWLADSKRDDPEMPWMVQFAPFYESRQDSPVRGRKSYSKLLLRLELPRGSYLIVETRADGGEWRECGKVIGRDYDTIPLRIAMNRCDKFEIRLRGKGSCTVLSLIREFSVGSER